MIGFRHALAFLTRLPTGAHPEDETAIGRSVPWFPVVGSLVGAATGLVYLGLDDVIAPSTAAIVAVAVGAVITGGLHEDGLADTFDGLGGPDPARRLEIMRDSRIGTFGKRRDYKAIRQYRWHVFGAVDGDVYFVRN